MFMLIKKSFTWFITSIVLTFSFISLIAEEHDLYAIKSNASVSSLRFNQHAQREVLEKLITRLTNPNLTNAKNIINNYFPDPSRYIKQFQPDVNGEGSIVIMDGESVQKVLLDVGESLWGIDRPPIMVFIAIESGLGEREIVVSDDGFNSFNSPINLDKNQPIKNNILSIAEERGLQIIFPDMNDKDQEALNFSDVWAGFLDNMLDVSNNYGASNILTAKIRQDEIREHEWRFYFGEDVITFRSNMDQAIHRVANLMSERYMYSGEIPPNEIFINFGLVDSIVDLGEIHLIFKSLSMVESYTINEINQNNIFLNVRYNGPRSDLELSLNKMDNIIPNSDLIRNRRTLNKNQDILNFNIN